MRLDARDGAGNSLPVWGRSDNGHLACDVMAAGVERAQNAPPSPEQVALIERIAFASGVKDVRLELDSLFTGLAAAEEESEHDQGAVVRQVAESLAENFILVVEMPHEVAGNRALAKINYDGPLSGSGRSLLDAAIARNAITVAGADWSGARSWHLEVQAPDGLMVEHLNYEAWDPDELTLLAKGSSESAGSTAHISGYEVPPEARTEARLVFAPDPIGLVNQTVVAAGFSWCLLMVLCLQATQVADVVQSADRAGALAGITLAIPAVLVAWMARSPEHELVSRLLVVPRLLSASTALVLLLAAVTLVLGPSTEQLESTALLLFAAQWVLLVWAVYVRLPVGGSP